MKSKTRVALAVLGVAALGTIGAVVAATLNRQATAKAAAAEPACCVADPSAETKAPAVTVPMPADTAVSPAKTPSGN